MGTKNSATFYGELMQKCFTMLKSPLNVKLIENAKMVLHGYFPNMQTGEE